MLDAVKHRCDSRALQSSTGPVPDLVPGDNELLNESDGLSGVEVFEKDFNPALAAPNLPVGKRSGILGESGGGDGTRSEMACQIV